MMKRSQGRNIGQAWLFAIGSLLVSQVSAQGADPAAQLGMREQDLLGAGLAPERVQRPERLASGARGLWRVAQMDWGGLQFQETFYLAQGKVQRIELLWLPDAAIQDSQLAFTRAVTSLEQTFGTAMMAGETASWALGDMDVAAYRTLSAALGSQLRIIYKVRELRDASTL